MLQKLEIILVVTDIYTLKNKGSLPSNSLRVLFAISLISMRDKDIEWVTGREVMPPDVGVVTTLGVKGDFRGRSMLRPTRLLRGILYKFLHVTSPETQKEKKERYSFTTVSVHNTSKWKIIQKSYNHCVGFLFVCF